MTYNVLENRKETLKTLEKSDNIKLKIGLVLIFIAYIGIAFSSYKNKYPKLSINEIVFEHFFDAVLWKHEKEKE